MSDTLPIVLEAVLANLSRKLDDKESPLIQL